MELRDRPVRCLTSGSLRMLCVMLVPHNRLTETIARLAIKWT